MSNNSIQKGTKQKKAKLPKPTAQQDSGKKWLKVIGFFFLVVVSALIGIWFASVVFSVRMKLPLANTVSNPFLIFDYYSAYGTNPNANLQKTFKIAFVFAGIVTLLVPLLFILGMKKRQSLYGDAKFATMDDIRKMGMLEAEPTSILMGKKNGRFLCYNGKQFGLLGAPTRSGKGVGWV
ncbi:type IV secretory system conjugative DNA transfer family protein, partial [Kingella kingae]|uniref:type IV secretory system conjugative DNA transfer family protein n=1 Tax=Kingella kingae TaxID=504 RepID=UPI00254D08A7